MKHPLIAVMALVALAAPVFADTDTHRLHASGTEPFWSVELAEQSLQINRLGLEPVTLPVTSQIGAMQVGLIVEAHDTDRALRAVLTTKPGLCHDEMSGMPFPAAASLTMGDEVLMGCAGRPLDLLLGGEWVVETLAGEALTGTTASTLHFNAEGALTGNTGCNRFSTGFELTGDALIIGPVASTMMACPEADMAQERQFIGALAQTYLFDIDENGALILSGADNAPLLLARR